MKRILFIFIIIAFASGTGVVQAGLLDNIKDNIDQSGKCKEGDKDCVRKEKIKAAGRVAAIGLAAKLVKDMIVNYKTKKVTNEEKVAEEYIKEHKKLPEKPIVSKYLATCQPEKVVKSGNKVIIHSDIIVVPGSDVKEAFVEENLSIFDNENHKEVIKSLKKPVNAKNKRGGRYQNEFSFTLPNELPQGIYPVCTTLWLNGKEVNRHDRDLQLVLHIDPHGAMEIVAMAD